MLKSIMFKEKTAPYSDIVVGECFAYNSSAFIKTEQGALNCTTYAIQSFDSSTVVIPYRNSILTLN